MQQPTHNYKKNKNKQQGGMGQIQQPNKRNGTKQRNASKL